MSRWKRRTCMMTYSVIIGSPLGGSTLPSGTFGSFGCLIKDSTPAARLNIAFKFGKTGSRSKSGCMNARYSMSLNSPASGQMRIAKSGSCSLNVSRHAFALPICLSSSIMSSAIRPPKRLVLDCFRYPPALGEAVSIGTVAQRMHGHRNRRRLPGYRMGSIGSCRWQQTVADNYCPDADYQKDGADRTQDDCYAP